MNDLRARRFIALQVALLFTWSLPTPSTLGQQPSRESIVGPALEEFHPSLIVGVRALAHEHIRIAELGIRMARGDVDAEKALIDEVIAGLPEDDRSGVRDDPPDADTAAEMLLSWKGWESFQDVIADARKRDRPFAPQHLLEVIWTDRLREMPDERDEPEIAAFVRRIEEIAGQPVPVRLWWPTVGYLLFGALHTPSFWPEDEAAANRARAELIQDLLEITTFSDDPEAARRVVNAALAPPLRGECARKAVTCASKHLARSSARVGFTADHLEFVSRFNQDGEAARRTGAPSNPWSASFEHLADFMAMMKLRILLEIDPSKVEKPGPLSCKYGTVEESLAYYKMVLETRDLQSFWIEARDDILKILERRFPHPHDAKIAVLDERLAEPTLTDTERSTLAAERARLAEERDRDQARISGFLAYQFCDRAPVESAVAEMRRLEASATSARQAQNLMHGWLALGSRDPSWAMQATEAHLSGTAPASRWCIAGAAFALQRHADEPDCGRALLELATHGDPNDRSAAMQNSGQIPEELARGMYDVAIRDVGELLRRAPDVQARRPHGDDAGYAALLRSAIGILRARATASPASSSPPTWIRDELLKTFDRDDVNLWKGGSPFAPDFGPGNREVLEWVDETLGDEEYRRLHEAGRIPADLKRVHDERKSERKRR